MQFWLNVFFYSIKPFRNAVKISFGLFQTNVWMCETSMQELTILFPFCIAHYTFKTHRMWAGNRPMK